VDDLVFVVNVPEGDLQDVQEFGLWTACQHDITRGGWREGGQERRQIVHMNYLISSGRALLQNVNAIADKQISKIIDD